MVDAGWVVAQVVVALFAVALVAVSARQIAFEGARPPPRGSARLPQLVNRVCLAGSIALLVRSVDPFGALGVYSQRVITPLAYATVVAAEAMIALVSLHTVRVGETLARVESSSRHHGGANGGAAAVAPRVVVTVSMAAVSVTAAACSGCGLVTDDYRVVRVPFQLAVSATLLAIAAVFLAASSRVRAEIALSIARTRQHPGATGAIDALTRAGARLRHMSVMCVVVTTLGVGILLPLSVSSLVRNDRTMDFGDRFSPVIFVLILCAPTAMATMLSYVYLSPVRPKVADRPAPQSRRSPAAHTQVFAVNVELAGAGGGGRLQALPPADPRLPPCSVSDAASETPAVSRAVFSGTSDAF